MISLTTSAIIAAGAALFGTALIFLSRSEAKQERIAEDMSFRSLMLEDSAFRDAIILTSTLTESISFTEIESFAQTLDPKTCYIVVNDAKQVEDIKAFTPSSYERQQLGFIGYLYGLPILTRTTIFDCEEHLAYIVHEEKPISYRTWCSYYIFKEENEKNEQHGIERDTEAA